MTNTIPPHYSEKFIIERYEKALNFIRSLPSNNSGFQPTNNQKLELYSLYKQVSQGNVNTSRPGIFDVVGRAKWDAWKKLEGISIIEARHIYVEALLRMATQAYQNNIGKNEAQQIIQAFAIMRPSEEEDSDDDTDDTSNQDETSTASEERDYLRDIIVEESNKVIPPSLVSSQDKLPSRRTSFVLSRNTNNRPSSVNSIQTMFTAPSTPRQSPLMKKKRPNSIISNTQLKLGQPNYSKEYERRSHHMTRNDLNVSPNNISFNDHDFDNTVNPWQYISEKTNHPKLISRVISHSDQNNQPNLISPNQTSNNRRTVHDNIDTSSVTETSLFHHNNTMHLYNTTNNSHNVNEMTNMNAHKPTSEQNNQSQSRYIDGRTSLFNELPLHSAVTLGPATKKALDALQNEVVALNNRINDLRRELVERDKQNAIKKKHKVGNKSDDNKNRWYWVIKIIAKYAGVNLITALVLLVLYKTGNPFVHAIFQ